jgi:LPS sulfotransferase NodH
MEDDEVSRLTMIPAPKVAKFRKKVGPLDSAPWPEIEGCLIALCSARSGSTLLCRQFETLYKIGLMGEALNWSKLKHAPASSVRKVVAARNEPWFAFKTSMSNMLALELTGFVDAYYDRTVFVTLIRRDIVAQAVSRAKAAQTGQWHVNRKPPGNAVYDADMIADAVRSIALHVEQMKSYAEGAGRPHARLFYEDIATSGLSAVKAVGDDLGLPRRTLNEHSELLRPIEKMGDEINDEWRERFLKEMNASIGEIVEDYVTAVDLGTSQHWASSDEAQERKGLKNVARHDRQLQAVLAKFPNETAALVRSAVDTLRCSFPTGSCFVIDRDDDELSIRFGADSGVSNAIFTIDVRRGKLKIYLEAENPIDDPANIVKGREGRKYIAVTEASSLASDAASALFAQAVRQARTPLPHSGRGRLVVKSRPTKTGPRE